MTHHLITTCSCTTKSKDTVFNQTRFIEQQSLSYKFIRESYFVMHVHAKTKTGSVGINFRH